MQLSRSVVLVVDDQPGVTAVVQAVLKAEGYTVESLADGGTALERIEAGGIDLVVLDRMLPTVDGLEVCRRVRAREREVYLPIIMLTGLAAPEQCREGFAAGADDYVVKPFRAFDLRDRVGVWARTRARLAAAYEQRQRDAARAEQARREGVRLAARTLNDQINNQLSRTITASELLREDPTLPRPLHELAETALQGAIQAANTVKQLERIIVIREMEWGEGVDTTIMLQRRRKQSKSG
jgi:DNA-binding response OmpR family regulator